MNKKIARVFPFPSPNFFPEGAHKYNRESQNSQLFFKKLHVDNSTVTAVTVT